MFYCPNCNNIYDIARTSSQVGGGQIVGESSSITFPTAVTTTASEVGIAITEPITSVLNNVDTLDAFSMVGGIDITNLINKILKDDTIHSDDIKNIDIDQITKSIDYKKLKQEEKEKIYNKL